MSQTLTCAFLAVCGLVGCTAELEAGATEAPAVPTSSPSRFVVALYETCSDRTTPADRVLMPSFRKDVEVTCVDTSHFVVGIEPEFARVISYDGYAGGLLVRCEHPTSPRWRETLSRRSTAALVADGRVLSEFHVMGDAGLDRCGIFSAENTEAAVAMCREMMRAWKKEPSTCERPCASEDPMATTCVER